MKTQETHTDEFTEGDLVAVFGGEIGKESHVADRVTLCKVLIVGQDDLAVECNLHYTSTYHTVPKSICTKMYLDPQILSSSSTLTPRVGDLVVAFSRGAIASEITKTSGILYKISYKLGNPDKCELLCGTDLVTVNWDSLIVLHRSSK